MPLRLKQSVKSTAGASQQGNVLTEYALIGLLILGCGLIALNTLGANVSGQFLSMLSSSQADSPALITNSQSAIQSATQSQGGKSVGITLSSGSHIQLPDYPGDLTTTITTLGANGATGMLANTMQAMADQMLVNGDISEEEHSQLTALSNQAHYIANIEKALEQAAARAADTDAFNATPIEFGGKTYTAQKLMMQIGYGNGSHDPGSVTDPMNDPTAQPETGIFQDLYKQALESGALNDPVALQTVQTLSDQIAHLSDISGIAAVKVITKEISPADMIQHMAGDASHMKSGGICETGGGEDTGVRCSD